MSARSDSQQAIMAGLNDKSFENAYDNEAKLRALITGKQVDQTNQLAAQDASISKAKQLASDMGELNPGSRYNVGVSKEGATMSQAEAPGPNPLAQIRADSQQERMRQNLISKVKSDYDKGVGTSPKRILAGQSVMKALDSGDITTLGRIKAQLPILEGENFKPTDAEREIMLQPTAEGAFGKLKNYLGGDSVPASPAQLNALRKFVESKLKEEQGLIKRTRGETLSRWKPNVKALDPDSMDALATTLGASSDELLQELQGSQQPPQGGVGSNLLQGLPGTGNSAPQGSSQPPGAPPAGSAGGKPPMSFKEFQAARRAGKI